MPFPYKACCEQHWQALETSVPAIPLTVTQSSPQPSRASCLMFPLSGICRDKVPPLYLPWRFPEEIGSGSIVQWQSTPSDPCNSDCLSDSLIYGACCSCPVWNVIGINSGTGWYRNHFHPNSSWEGLWGGDWWCSLGVGGGVSLSCLQRFGNILPSCSNSCLQLHKILC